MVILSYFAVKQNNRNASRFHSDPQRRRALDSRKRLHIDCSGSTWSVPYGPVGIRLCGCQPVKCKVCRYTTSAALASCTLMRTWEGSLGNRSRLITVMKQWKAFPHVDGHDCGKGKRVVRDHKGVPVPAHYCSVRSAQTGRLAVPRVLQTNVSSSHDLLHFAAVVGVAEETRTI